MTCPTSHTILICKRHAKPLKSRRQLRTQKHLFFKKINDYYLPVLKSKTDTDTKYQNGKKRHQTVHDTQGYALIGFRCLTNCENLSRHHDHFHHCLREENTSINRRSTSVPERIMFCAVTSDLLHSKLILNQPLQL